MNGNKYLNWFIDFIFNSFMLSMNIMYKNNMKTIMSIYGSIKRVRNRQIYVVDWLRYTPCLVKHNHFVN